MPLVELNHLISFHEDQLEIVREAELEMYGIVGKRFEAPAPPEGREFCLTDSQLIAIANGLVRISPNHPFCLRSDPAYRTAKYDQWRSVVDIIQKHLGRIFTSH